MDSKRKVMSQIRHLVKQYFDRQSIEDANTDSRRMPLIAPSYGWQEVVEAIDSMLSTQVTMGSKVKQFESMFAEYIGKSEAIMVNSGSSANLLAISLLTNPAFRNRIKPGDEVITPAVTWATTVYPIINCGLVPVLVDVSLETFDIDVKEIQKAINPRTRAILLVHLLGNPCDMDSIMEISEKYKLFVIEDACEAHGAEYKGMKVGSFGHISTFSFYFSHHITTIEGGMVLTDDEEIAELARSLRVFGWIRDLKEKDRFAAAHADIDPRYLFTNIGYNFRPTEIQGAFGIHQMRKLEELIKIRRENARFLTQNLKEFGDFFILHEERENTRHAWFGYPLTVKAKAPFTRKQIVTFLEKRGVETRPIMCGNIDEQPVMRLFPYRKIGELTNSRFIMRNSFFFGNHQAITRAKREALVEYLKEFTSELS